MTTKKSQPGIASFFAGSSSTHDIPVGEPSPAPAKKRTNVAGSDWCKQYVEKYPGLRWAVHPNVANASSSSTTVVIGTEHQSEPRSLRVHLAEC